jgi:hypothetical protein
MFKDVLNHLGRYTSFAEVGLVIFFGVFVAITVRTLSRSRSEVQDWSRLPLEDDTH